MSAINIKKQLNRKTSKGAAVAKVQHLMRVFTRNLPRVETTFDRYAARADPYDPELSTPQLYAVAAYSESRMGERTLVVNNQCIPMPQLTAGKLGMLDYDLMHTQHTGPHAAYFTQLRGIVHTQQQWYAVLADYCMKRVEGWVRMLYREVIPAAQAFLDAEPDERIRLAGERPHSSQLAIAALYLICLGPLIDFADQVAKARGYGPNYWLRILNTI